MAKVPARMRIARVKRLCADAKPGRFAKWIGVAGRPKNVEVSGIPYSRSLKICDHIGRPMGARLKTRAVAAVMLNPNERRAVVVATPDADINGVDCIYRYLRFGAAKVGVSVGCRDRGAGKQDDCHQKRLYEAARAGRRIPACDTPRASRKTVNDVSRTVHAREGGFGSWQCQDDHQIGIAKIGSMIVLTQPMSFSGNELIRKIDD